ncbi:MAG: hypothetical protein JWP63_3616 [Candidatus Solibacter sp.]|nr:hypothetical protein [Candidatus Solibacter sp.]
MGRSGGRHALGAAQTSSKPTFTRDGATRDGAPILQRNCQTCHRPGEAAPFLLLTCEPARQWAKAIKDVVMEKKMPPWFGESQFGRFANDASFSQSGIHTLVAWVDPGTANGVMEDQDVIIPTGFRAPVRRRRRSDHCLTPLHAAASRP